MTLQKPLYIRLTSYSGHVITLSPTFTMHAVEKNLNKPSQEPIKQFSLEEQEELQDYIARSVIDRGLNSKKVRYSKPSWPGPVPIWSYYGRNTDILNNFMTASTLIITSMDTKRDEVVVGGDGSLEIVTRIEAVQHWVIQTVDEIEHALNNEISDLHSEDNQKNYQRASIDQAKSIIDSNLDNIVKSSFWKKAIKNAALV